MELVITLLLARDDDDNGRRGTNLDESCVLSPPMPSLKINLIAMCSNDRANASEAHAAMLHSGRSWPIALLARLFLHKPWLYDEPPESFQRAYKVR